MLANFLLDLPLFVPSYVYPCLKAVSKMFGSIMNNSKSRTEAEIKWLGVHG